MTDLARHVRNIADFPKAGIVFKDLTPLLADADAFADSIRALSEPFRDSRLDAILGIEARGFIFGAAMALELGVGFVPLRKPGKLPSQTIGVDYALEYGSDRIEMHVDAVAEGARVLLVDDVLATGGTLAAAVELARLAQATVVGAALVAEISTLAGRSRCPDLPLHVLMSF